MKQKGFTLLELLAVVIVLAIVTLIAIPIIMNVIENAKKGSAIDSAYGYIDTLEKNVALGQIDPSKGIIIPQNNELNMQNPDDAYVLDKIPFKGNRPGYVEITFEKQKVISAGLCIDGYSVEYKNKKAKISDINYCEFAKVTNLEVTNDDITFNGNVGTLFLPLGESYVLNINVEGSSESTYQISSDNENVIKIEGDTLTSLQIGFATITVSAGIRYKRIETYVSNNSILGFISAKDYGETGDYYDEIGVNGQVYPIHVVNYDSDLVINDTVTIGEETDVGTSSTNATNMVVLKVNGDLVINEDAILQPIYTSYGGPKGFLVYVTGTLTNNGTIRNLRGAKAAGQNVYLWKNSNNTYEYVPAAGGAGAALVSYTWNQNAYNETDYKKAGTKGTNGSNRGTGGGGSGGINARRYDYTSFTIKSGAGSAGTSYSGGSGGGGADMNSNGTRTAGGAVANGGAGGAGYARRGNTSWAARNAGGGAGNPGGAGKATASGKTDGTANTTYNGASGTGGLLIIYADRILNEGTITVKGSNGGAGRARGGSSGGGSLNIFYGDNSTINGTLTAAGGSTTSNDANGGAGGSGTITIGSIATGNFVAG